MTVNMYIQYVCLGHGHTIHVAAVFTLLCMFSGYLSLTSSQNQANLTGEFEGCGHDI